MRKGKQFLRRALTVFMSLAIVFTSVNVPTMTVMAAQEDTNSELLGAIGINASYLSDSNQIKVVWGQDEARINAGYTYCITVTGTDTTEPYTAVYDDKTCAEYKLDFDSENNTGDGYEVGKTYKVEIQSKLDGKYSVLAGDANDTATVLIEAASGDGNGESTEATEAPATPLAMEAKYWAEDDANKGKIHLAWNNTYSTGGKPSAYNIYVDNTKVTSVEADVNATFIENTYAAGKHIIGLTAENNIGESSAYTVELELSAEQAGSIKDPSTLAPAKPLGLVAEYYAGESDEDVNKGTIKVAWNNTDIGSAGTPSSYIIYVDDVQKTTVEATASPEAYLENTFEAEKNYTIGLTAKNDNGESEKATVVINLTEEQAGVAPTPNPTVAANVVISEQIDQAFEDEAVVLTYVADSDAFTFSGYTVKINGTDVTADTTIDEDAKTITLAGTLFADAGVYDITVAQEDCTFTPVYQRVYEDGSTDDWNLIWNDEFDGTELNEEYWDHQIGRGGEYTDTGWGNQEEQYYTDSTENSSVANGKLTITAKKDASYAGANYTSARIRTTGVETGKTGVAYNPENEKVAKAYGKIEAKIKMPAADGVWPAFWMLPENSEYGTWAASGEIDIMEAKGRLDNVVYGTLHYGGKWPNNTSTGNTFDFEKAGKPGIDEYHVYGIEWKPGEIRWYVDGELYATQNNWYAEADNTGDYPYPAPFDEEFHILLNMAVGGTFDSAVSSDAIEVDENGVSMDVDYVRWYQLEEGYDDSNVTLPEVEKDTSATAAELLALADANGNFIVDGDFANLNTTPYTSADSWEISRGYWAALLIPGNGGGSATWEKTVVDEKNYAKINVTNAGSTTYSSQMLQYFPVVKGYTYEVSYTAYTDNTNTKSDISFKIGGDGDNDWSTYSRNYSDALSTKPTTYTHRFTMANTTDPTARFEFNLATSAGIVYLSDVSVKVLGDDASETDKEDNAKEPAADGNHVYNGEFTIGSDRLLYWHWGTNDETGVVSSVLDGTDRVASVNVTTDAIALWQKGINLLQNDTYKLTADVNSDAAQTLNVALTNADGTVTYATRDVSLSAGENALSETFTMPTGNTDTEGVLKLTFNGTAKIDSVKLVRTTNNNVDINEVNLYPLYNGDFFNGTDGWNIWHNSPGYQTNSVNENGQLVVNTTMGAGAAFHSVGIKSSGMILTKGINYKVAFDYTLASDKNYTLELAKEQRKITLPAGENVHYVSEAFSGNGSCEFALYLGPDEAATYDLIIDNIVVYVDPDNMTVPDGYAQPVSLKQKGYGKLNTAATILYSENDATAAWETAEKTYYLNGEAIDADKVSIDTDANTLTIDGSYFTEGGAYTFAVKADGFLITQEAKITVLATSNLLINGDFSDGLNNWSSWSVNSCADLAVNTDGVLEVTHKWNEGNSWDIQLYQTGLEYEAGTYVVEFDAYSDVERPITIQLENGGGLINGTANSPVLTTEQKHYKLFMNDLDANSAVKFFFMMGNVSASGITTPNSGDQQNHKIYLDNIQFRPVEDADYSTVAGIIASDGAATVGDDITITYTQAYNAWKSAAKTVYVNDRAIANDLITMLEDGSGLVIDGSVFATAGIYKIKISAEGFDDTNVVSKIVNENDGNLILNGTFDSSEGWVVYDEDEETLSDGKIADGKYTLDYTKGYFRDDWNCWVTWSSQLKKENLSLTAGKEYKLQFKADTSMTGGRDIIVEFRSASATEGTAVQQTVSLSEETKAYEITFTPGISADDFYICFLLGPIGSNLQVEDQTNVAHSVTMDDISLYEKSKAPSIINYLTNGDFSNGTTGWGFYMADWENAAGGSFTVNDDEVAVINHIWDSGESWHFQLYQAGMEYEAGDMVVSFDAWSDVTRPIGVQVHNGDTVLQNTVERALLTTEKQSFKFIYKGLEANTNAKLDFELGSNITFEGVTSPNDGQNPHNIYMDNIVFRPAVESDFPTAAAGTISSAGTGTANNDVFITYSDASDEWKAALKTVYVNDVAVAEAAVTEAEDGSGLTIAGSVFPISGYYTIKLTAEGFADTNTITKSICGTDGNRIINGTFDSADGWVVYDEDEGLSNGEIADGKYTLDYTQGYFRTDWNCWVTWSSQLKKENISVEAGKSYRVEFTADTTMTGGRDVIMEYRSASEPESAAKQEIIHLNETSTVHEVFITPNVTADDFYICFLLGPVGSNLQVEDQTGVAHTLTMDDIKLQEVSEGLWIKAIPDQTYTGKKIQPVISVYDGTKKLTLKKDYTISYSQNTNVGIASVTVKGKGNYTSSDTKTFNIVPKSLNADDITVNASLSATIKKNGKLTNPSITVKMGKTKLKARRDYEVVWPETLKTEVKSGHYTVTIKAIEDTTDTKKCNFTGKIEIPYDVLAYGTTPMSKVKVTLDPKTSVSYSADCTTTPVVKEVYTGSGSKKVVYEVGKHFEIVYPTSQTIGKNNVITLKAKVNDDCTSPLYGTKTVKFTVTGTKLSTSASKFEITGIDAKYPYTGNRIEPVVTIKDLNKLDAEGNAYVLKYKTDYTVEYDNCVNAGKNAKVIITGVGAYTGKITKKFEISKTDLSVSGNVIKIEKISDQTYTGKKLTPNVEVTVNGLKLTAKKDYTVTYAQNTAVGTATVTVKGKGNYAGTGSAAIATFNIVPRPLTADDITTNTSLSATIKKNGKLTNPSVTVKMGKTKLKARRDYEVVWPEALKTEVKSGHYTVTIKAIEDTTDTKKCNFTGKIEIPYDVLAYGTVPMSKVKVTLDPKTSVAYSADCTTTPVVKEVYTGSGNSKVVYEAGKDFEIVYPTSQTIGKNNVITLKAKVNDDCTSPLYGTKTVKFTVTGTKLSTSASKFEVTGIDKKYPYTGNRIEPVVTIKDLNKLDAEGNAYVLKYKTDYIVEYDNCVNAGKNAKVIITGVGAYTGKITKKFEIEKESMSLSQLFSNFFNNIF